ncbi:MAG TPA: hypothetical protein DF296_10765 [Candidatus Margulisbacteria bacterium]|nr:hypothetical protein [Candidatus Margulisiibacteriota bacterium]
MTRFVLIDNNFKKKVKVIKRYLYLVKSECEKFEVGLRNFHNNQEVIQAKTVEFINQISTKVYIALDAHFHEITAILISECEYGRKYYTKNQRYKVYQEYYKRQLKEYFIGCEFVQQTLYKPFGYPGDFNTLDYIYRGGSSSASIYFNLMDNYIMGKSVATAVRGRRPYLLSNFEELIKLAKDSISIASVACGAAMEFIDFASEPISKPIDLYLLDSDNTALEKALFNIDNAGNEKIRPRYLNMNILAMDGTLKSVDGIDLVYSVGLFDYLRDGIFIKTAKRLFQLLSECGKLIIGNMALHPARAFMELIGEWHLLYRSEEELIELATRCGFEKYKIEVDTTGVQFYLVVEKNN